MYLFIFESIGTSELILIGVIALIFLGPRKMPDIARKIGKVMAEFRSTTSDFKQTWEREVNFEDEVKAFSVDDDDQPLPVERENSIAPPTSPDEMQVPAIRQIDISAFEESRDLANKPEKDDKVADDDLNDKKNWL